MFPQHFHKAAGEIFQNCESDPITLGLKPSNCTPILFRIQPKWLLWPSKDRLLTHYLTVPPPYPLPSSLSHQPVSNFRAFASAASPAWGIFSLEHPLVGFRSLCRGHLLRDPFPDYSTKQPPSQALPFTLSCFMVFIESRPPEIILIIMFCE